MKRSMRILSCLVLLLTLAACGQVQQIIDDVGDQIGDFITPAQASLNGYSVERDASGLPTGKVDLNISALDNKGNPIDGAFKNPVVSVDKVITPRGTLSSQQVYEGTATIKYDIDVKEVINAVMDIDQSGSMKKTDPERKRVDAAKSFIDRISQNDRVAVMAFLGKDPVYRNSVLLQDFTNDKALLGAAVDKVEQKTITPIWDSVLDTIQLHDEDVSNEAGGEASRVVLLFTDGRRNGGDTEFPEALAAAQESGIKFFTVGLSAGREAIDTAELQQLANETEGTFANVGNPDELEALFNKIFNAMRASGVITLSFNPVPADGSLVTGTVDFDLSGKHFKLPYAIQF